MRFQAMHSFRSGCFALILYSQICAGVWSAQAPGQLAEARKSLDRGEASRAAEIARQYLLTYPGDSPARIFLARSLMAQGNYLGAYSELSQVLRKDPKNLDGLYYLSKASVVLSQSEYRELSQQSPDFYRVHQLLAESYVAQENKPKAEEEYQIAIAHGPPSPDLLDSLADLKREGYQFDDAARDYHRALEMEPQDYRALYGLCACAIFESDIPQAVDYFRKAAHIDPESAAARLALGDALLRDNQAAAAIDELKAAVSIEPNMRQAFALLARAYTKTGQPQLAQAAVGKDRALTRSNAETLEKALEPGKQIIPPPDFGRPHDPQTEGRP